MSTLPLLEHSNEHTSPLEHANEHTSGAIACERESFMEDPTLEHTNEHTSPVGTRELARFLHWGTRKSTLQLLEHATETVS